MPESSKKKDSESHGLSDFYESVDEDGRLSLGYGQLEWARTLDILGRYLPLPPAVIYDVGGGSGVYAFWLARKGYKVHLVDPVAKHIRQAWQASLSQPDYPLASIVQGDACRLDLTDASADAVLLMGPLYHLPDRKDRIAALKEVSRVTRKGGRIFVAVISRLASLLDGIFQGFLDDPAFAAIVEQDLIDGQHRNPTENPAYFTSVFFHHPDDIKSEINESGLLLEQLLPVESIGGLISPFEEYWSDQNRRMRLLKFLRKVETDPSLLGVSSHLLAIVKKPE
jgi:ubiquinone/menaquinone biosynthesis C-methylase UbiE